MSVRHIILSKKQLAQLRNEFNFQIGKVITKGIQVMMIQTWHGKYWQR